MSNAASRAAAEITHAGIMHTTFSLGRMRKKPQAWKYFLAGCVIGFAVSSSLFTLVI